MTTTHELIYKVARRHARREALVRVRACPFKLDHKDASEDNGRVFIANTADVDLDNEVVVPAGADTTYFFKNRTIFLDHDYTKPVARLRYASLKGGKWVVNMTFGRTPLALEAKANVDDGVVNGSSIGFIPTDYGRPTAEEVKAYGPHESIVRTWEWLELSLTGLPCNVGAGLVVGEAKHATAPKKKVLLFLS